MSESPAVGEPVLLWGPGLPVERDRRAVPAPSATSSLCGITGASMSSCWVPRARQRQDRCPARAEVPGSPGKAGPFDGVPPIRGERIMAQVADLVKEEEQHEREDLVRGLKGRHVQLIALGGAIGVGLFLGSATAISRAGPGLLLAYAAGGPRGLLHHAGTGRAPAVPSGGRCRSPAMPRSSSGPGPASSPAGPTGSCGWSSAWRRSPPWRFTSIIGSPTSRSGSRP